MRPAHSLDVLIFGDAALTLLVGLVRTQLDSDDLFGRFGGDEFLIGCRQPTDDVVDSA